MAAFGGGGGGRASASASAPPDLQALISSAISQTMEASDSRWDGRTKELVAKQDEKTDLKIAALKGDIVQEIEALKNQVAAFSETSSRLSASDVGAASSSTAGNGPRKDFVPKLLKIKGFVTDWNRRQEQGMNQPDTRRHIKTILGYLEPEFKKLFDEEASLRTNNRVVATQVILRFKEGLPGEDAWAAKREIDRLLAEKSDLEVSRQKVRAVMEASPERQPILNQGGKAYSVLQRLGIKVKINSWTDPLEVYWIEDETKPRLLATWTSKGGWSLQEGVLHQAVGEATSPATLMALLRQ